MSEPRDTATTDTVEPPQGLILLGTPDGSADAGECADGFCAL